MKRRSSAGGGLPRLKSTSRAKCFSDGIKGHVTVAETTVQAGGHHLPFKQERWSPQGVLSQDTLRKRTPPRLSIQVCGRKWPGSQQHCDRINTAGHGTDDDNDDFILIAGSLAYLFLVTFITVYSINS